MSIRSALIGLMLGNAVSCAYAQTAPSPADVGIVKQSPNVFKLLDTSKTWTPFGTVNEHTHIFSPATNGPIPTGNCVKWGPGIQDAGVSCGTGTGVPAFSEADILVTDPAVGMASGGQDNSPFVAALMNKISNPQNAFVSGYDVLFPGIAGQVVTEYYFTQPLDLTQGANYHCSGTTFASSTYLVFAPGVDGVIQDVSGGGMISGCSIITLGKGTATANAVINPSVLTHILFRADPAEIMPAPTWHVGDGILLSSPLNAGLPSEALLLTPTGTTVTAINGTTGDLTLSHPVSPYFGGPPPYGRTAGTATFTESGSNNFVNGDTIKVGSTTYTFVSNITTSSTDNSVLIGATFAASAANLVSAVMGEAGMYKTYVPTTTGEQAYAANLEMSAAVSGGAITFTSIHTGPAVNAFASVYTAAATSAGAFGGATFSGSNDASNCPAPCTAMDGPVATYQFPGSNSPSPQNFKVQTTAGDYHITAISGPRPLVSGDLVFSDAFPFGSIVYSINQATFPQSAVIVGPTEIYGENASVTHASGSEGDLWIVPAAIARRSAASAEHNYLFGWPIGLLMACSSGGGINCDLSRDTDNWHQGDWIGRFSAGNNYSTASSYDEEFANNMIMDVWEGGTLGITYYNLNSESPESGSARYSLVMNCVNQNTTTIFGGYMAGSGGWCNGTDASGNPSLFPPNIGGPLLIGPLSATGAGPTLGGNSFTGVRGFQWTGGNDHVMCVGFGGPPGTNPSVFSFSANQCETGGSSWKLNWNPALHYWEWDGADGAAMRFTDTAYLGYFASTVMFPNGFMIGNASNYNGQERWLGSYPALPTGFHLRGDTSLVSTPSPGGNLAWSDTPSFSTTLSANIISGTTTSVAVAACPSPALPNGTQIVHVATALSASGALLDAPLGTLNTCVGATLTFNAAALASAPSGDTIQFMAWRPAAHIANDAGGTNWPVATWTDVADLTPCTGYPNVGLSVVYNGQTAAAAGYNAAVGSTTGGTVRLVFCDGTSWTYH